MIAGIIDVAIDRRWVVVTIAIIVALFGAFALTKLPIDAVPDITNKQVQINTIAPALSPAEIEKQVTFPIETALAGAPGLESTRSLSRNGFSQITAVFSERTDIYFARQQIGERLTEIRARLPQGIEPRIGPVSTGLGEIYMWSVHYAGKPVERDGMPGLQRDGRFLTRRRSAPRKRDRAQCLSAHGAGLDHQAANQDGHWRRWRRRDRRLSEAVPGQSRRRKTDRTRADLRGCCKGYRSQQCQPWRALYRAQRRRHRGALRRPPGKRRRTRRRRRIDARRRAREGARPCHRLDRR